MNDALALSGTGSSRETESVRQGRGCPYRKSLTRFGAIEKGRFDRVDREVYAVEKSRSDQAANPTEANK